MQKCLSSHAIQPVLLHKNWWDFSRWDLGKIPINITDLSINIVYKNHIL